MSSSSSSSNSPPNYADGVPVKISEKFKPPPDIQLTSKLVHQLSRTQIPVAFEDYNFDLERKIISKTSEWMNYRLKEKTDRHQRIHQRELARQKWLEEEQKVKLNQVSYPSADELTSSCDEDENCDNEATTAARHANQQITSIPSEKLFSENFNSNAILMPTQVMPDMATAAITNNKKSHRRYASNSSNKIDFSFFESDASPFDHLEMKSMNEMEELSKILQSTAVDADDMLERNNSSESESSCENQRKTNENNNNNVSAATINDCAIESRLPPQPPPTQSYVYPQHEYNSYYSSGASPANNQAYQFAAAATLNRQNYTHSPYAMNQQQQQQQLPNNCYYTQNYAVNHMNYIMGHQNNNNSASEDTDAAKSNSVPDIIKELNDELNNSERRRIRNNSQNSNNKNVIERAKEEEEEANEEVKHKLASIKDKEDQLSKLSPKSQAIAKQISQMGFNLSMVIRSINRIGDNDKKIVEHLISLSELLQMGFDENLVSEALVKFDNNKDRALDFLIS